MEKFSRTVCVEESRTEKMIRLAGECSRRALLEEVYTTPKPGLVDCHDNGAHKDMDIRTFEASTAAIVPYLQKMFETGLGWSDSPEALFHSVRRIGMEAEQAMFDATGGVNTHKGAIFTLGILSASAGRHYGKSGQVDSSSILAYSAWMTEKILGVEFEQIRLREPRTHGERLYHDYGVKGIRGEAQAGFPILRDTALPALWRARRSGQSGNSLRLYVLLEIMEKLNDTNVLTRSSCFGLFWLQRQAADILSFGGPDTPAGIRALQELNRRCIRRNISPGGAADILAAALFLDHLEAAGSQ